MKMSFFGMLFLLLVIYSCSDQVNDFINEENATKENDDVLKTTETDILLFMDKVLPSVSNLSIHGRNANNIRSLSNNETQKVIGGEIESLNPIKQGEETLFWAVNFTENSGFILLSANKIDFPVLGFSEDGNFNLSQAEIDNLKNNISPGSLDIKDTINNENYKLWEELLNCEEDEEIEIEFVAEDLKGEDRKPQVRIAAPMPDRETPKNRESMYRLGYNLQWEMRSPYNYGIRQGHSVSEPALALGHYMYINWYPYKYNWMFMHPSLDPMEYKETPVSLLLKELTEDLDPWYYPGDQLNSSYVDRYKVHDIPKLLQNKYEYGYGGDLMPYNNDEESFLKVYNELHDYKPVLFFYHYNGTLNLNSPTANKILMAWVVDGYQEVHVKYTKKKTFLGMTVTTKTWYLYKDFFHRIGEDPFHSGWFDQEYASRGIKPDEHDYQMVMCKKYALINVKKYSNEDEDDFDNNK